MKKLIFSALLGLVFAVQVAQADSTWVYAVEVHAATQLTPPQITLQWKPDPYGAQSYTVYRKGPDGAWGAGTTLPGSATQFVDANVRAGVAYEYQIAKAATLGYAGYGYIYAGIRRGVTENRGKVILMVDATVAAPLDFELRRLQLDMRGDGWTVLRHDVPRAATPAQVKNIILADYRADPARVKALFLFGHVPILRSGNLNPDGHQARPMPADSYYGDMDGAWGNNDYLPSDVELMVGRVDLANMPGLNIPEVDMLRNYLNKDHNWRHGLIQAPRRALLGNRFGDRDGEAFAASGFRSFAPMVGPENVVLANEQDNAPVSQRWISMLASQRWLWAYGCGGGSYVSMSAMGTQGPLSDVTSYDLVSQDAKAVFTMMMGSWFGEWDSQDNLLRAMLATPTMGLTASWSGRPHWFYHHMALGEPIGFSARLTMNNNGAYRNQVNSFARGVHIALMGDPTLRLHPIVPPSKVRALRSGAAAVLNWTASPEAAGYYVYRYQNGLFVRIPGRPVIGTTFVDPTPLAGPAVFYMVRGIKLEPTHSGSYWNLSQGAFAKLP